MKILVLDNYDSFVYNLVHMLRELGQEPDIYRNDKINLDQVDTYDKILLSPGPGIPEEAGIMPQLIDTFQDKKSILGVCLGHQAIGEAWGAQLYNLPRVLHGMTSDCHISDDKNILFQAIPRDIKIGHYHSWIIDEPSLPAEIKVSARDGEGHIMAIRHDQYDVWGLQFHPESILTEFGKDIIQNWLNH